MNPKPLLLPALLIAAGFSAGCSTVFRWGNDVRVGGSVPEVGRVSTPNNSNPPSMTSFNSNTNIVPAVPGSQAGGDRP